MTPAGMVMVVKLWTPGGRYVGFTIGLNAPSSTTHVPLMQSAVAPHTVVQVPQWLGSLLRSAHPVEQQVSPGPQAGPPLHCGGFWQVPATQVPPGAHALPHEPQLLSSVIVSAQPLGQHFCVPVQAGPPLHVAWHAPPTQIA